MVKEQVSNKYSISDKLQRYAFRSNNQILVHAAVAIILAVLFSFILGTRISVSGSSFVLIVSSMGTISGALLAISLALFFFFSRHVTDWRDKIAEKLVQGRAELRAIIQRSAQHHPDISRHLAALYEKSLTYFPGQLIEMEEIDKAGSVFVDWATNQAKKRARRIDLGNPKEYNSFELQLRDAYICYREVKHVFRLIRVAELHIRATAVFSPLIIAWVLILTLTLTSALIGSIGIIPNNLGFPVLIIPFYLLFVAVFALIKDVMAIMSITIIQETAYDEALLEISSGPTSKGEPKNKV